MPTFTNFFTEIVIDHNLVIPDHKPPAECLLDSVIDFEITKAVVFDTPLESPEITGVLLRKALVVGIAHIIVKYAAAVPDQQVHGAHFDVPFNALVEMPDGPTQGTNICVEPVVEKSVFCLEDDRRVSKIIVVRLDIYTAA
ncbi:DUF3794 domain-containing protein [Desulfitobacterium metallireducens]|uniref:SipL SPOCS domain-containing protein n=1 Tax=Desulfitobacterium metallireducens DSM 15288 TaxID=871968 RepID=W0EA84_9FIRM|nr:DUF3794 domain-containing protein [Desulfitobacterium metallireducens]AHF06139.1 hypothetical protein DESME_03045 [Desulfitobacterium metallireducens DSM 15288]